MRLALITAILTILSACNTPVPYRDDVAYPVSASSGSPEFFALIDQHPCVDVFGLSGVCSARVRSDKSVTLSILPQPYSYRLVFTCPKSVGIEHTADVKAEAEFKLLLDQKQYETQTSFLCIGEVFPDDRKAKVSMSFEIRFKIVSADYLEREDIRLDGDVLNLGRFARTSWVFDSGRWTRHDHKTEVEVSDPSSVQAVSESWGGRFATFNLR